VGFSTSKSTWKTAPNKCQVNYVVLDSDWEAELARVLESHPKIRSYGKNQAMQFKLPYRDGAVPRKYIPDFIVQVDDGRDDIAAAMLSSKRRPCVRCGCRASIISAHSGVGGSPSFGTRSKSNRHSIC
jgi:type III restriction enzyme